MSSGLPVYSLNTLSNPLADLTPVLKFIVEGATARRLTPEGPQDLKESRPAKGVYGLLARALEKIPGLHRWTTRGPSGQIYLNGKLLEALSALPSSRVGSLASLFEGAPPPNRPGQIAPVEPNVLGRLLGPLTSVSSSVLDPAEEQFALRERKQKLADISKLLYGMGYKTPKV
jgi:hypothetical protein